MGKGWKLDFCGDISNKYEKKEIYNYTEERKSVEIRIIIQVK
jgi:hypothetical protein